jgi:hypothetical protein
MIDARSRAVSLRLVAVKPVLLRKAKATSGIHNSHLGLFPGKGRPAGQSAGCCGGRKLRSSSPPAALLALERRQQLQ